MWRLSFMQEGNSELPEKSIVPVFDPAGPYAGSITILSWILITMACGVLLIVLAALWVALFGESGSGRSWAERKRCGSAGSAFLWWC